RIKHTYILDDPFDDPPQLAELIPENSPLGKPRDEVAEERLEDSWVPLDETVDPGQLEELIRSKEAHANAVILESVGDIPDAEVKPPDNVLFVCKLNPVTQDEDLYTIFSRFGSVTSAEIIRDFKTGDSLCYAFIGMHIPSKLLYYSEMPRGSNCVEIAMFYLCRESWFQFVNRTVAHVWPFRPTIWSMVYARLSFKCY
uniref:peptidylprolyl isomerase n=1 Tax=Aegilops tauschii subsp. strangulata TaxID=200361 RepID=A0A453SYL2_AEGTS